MAAPQGDVDAAVKVARQPVDCVAIKQSGWNRKGSKLAIQKYIE